ncbi:hypothetical protein [Garciella nitratireducens]|uniref:Uncharacterized protein n=1 Tax=Garciella nitratireducens DSM 15102 TaxID=1121911 RepID=A0A1T4MER4_9FIRM|nr:hypothetical protein [Garciella nitratireducens]SJZ65403.1 hypothetical protein SAMN02745973_01304 [Garciella nitratireducens DSM 15102]
MGRKRRREEYPEFSNNEYPTMMPQYSTMPKGMPGHGMGMYCYCVPYPMYDYGCGMPCPGAYMQNPYLGMENSYGYNPAYAPEYGYDPTINPAYNDINPLDLEVDENYPTVEEEE